MRAFIITLIFISVIYSTTTYAQQRDVELIGMVTDHQGEPLLGVTIRVRNTQFGTVTDTDGRYLLRGRWKEGEIIVFSFVGMKDVRIKYSGQKVQDAAMQQDTKSLDEVVIVAKSNINELDIRAKSGVVQRVDMERLNSKPIAAFYRKLYTRPEGTTYVICGNFNPDSVMRQFVSVFGRIPISSSPSEYAYPPFKLPTVKYVEGFPNDNETQTLFDYLFFGHFEPGLKSTLTLKLMRDVIRNRLISVLRERESLVYSPYISLMYDGIPWGTFYFDINASADNRNMPGIDVLLKDILQKLQREEVDMEELQTIKRSFRIAKREALNEEASATWRSTLVGLLKNRESLADFERYEECLDSITPAALRVAFERYLDIENYVLLYLSKKQLNNDTKNN